MPDVHPETQRFRLMATRYRSKYVELESQFGQYITDAHRRLLAARSAKPEEYRIVEERQKIQKTRADLLEMFINNDVDHKNAMNYQEFKNGMLLMGFMSDESVIQRTFRQMDVDCDELISESEFLAGVLGKRRADEYSFKSQIDNLNIEIKNVELKCAEDGDEIEKLLLENEQLRSEYESGMAAENKRLKAELESQGPELERMKILLNDMTQVHSDFQVKLKDDLEREIHRLREFSTAMRNQLNLLQREFVVSTRSAARKICEMSGATEEELKLHDKETERSQRIAQVRQVFINLDDQHMGDMDFEKFTQAFQWLNRGDTVEQLQKQFARLDVNNTGLIDEDTFLSAVVSDLNLEDYTPKRQADRMMGKLSEFDDHISELVGGDVSQKLRERIAAMKNDMNSQVGSIFSAMGLDPSKFLSEEALQKHLSNAFDKFDNSRDGRLNFKEFQSAWKELGLKASVAELRDAFNVVDTDKSGLIDKHEFISAVKDNRLTELNMNVLLKAMGVEVGNVRDKYAAYNATQSRRRKQRKTMEATLASSLSDMADLLCQVTGRKRDLDKSKAIQEMTETFERFDRNGSGELNLEEYQKAWRFLGRAGSDADITKAFKTVDIDNSGFIEFEEFVFSLMGDEAQKYGLLADMEFMLPILKEISQDLKDLRSDRSEAEKRSKSTQERLTILAQEVNNRTDSLVARLQKATGDDKVLEISDLDRQIREAFTKADSNGTGVLNLWQFSQAWMNLGLGGNEEDLKEFFSSADRFGSSGGIDQRQFLRVVKSQRLEELSLRCRLATLEYLFDLVSGSALTSQRRRILRQKFDLDMMPLLEKMIDDILPATEDALSQAFMAKKDRHKALKEAFIKFDQPRTGELTLKAFVDARRYAGFSGSDKDLEETFKMIDVDNSGRLDFYEFIYSDMGKKANKVSPFGYVKILNKLLGSAADKYKKLADPTLASPSGPSNHVNAIRLNARKMIQRMTGFRGVDKNKLDKMGIHIDRRANSMPAVMLEHILHDPPN